jgi:hypothetical protein
MEGCGSASAPSHAVAGGKPVRRLSSESLGSVSGSSAHTVDSLYSGASSVGSSIGSDPSETDSETAMMGGVAGRRANEYGVSDGVLQFAKYLGMNAEQDRDLLWIASQAMNAKLPPDWHEHEDGEGNQFYYNRRTKESSWEHPLDSYYRQLYAKHKDQRSTDRFPAYVTFPIADQHSDALAALDEPVGPRERVKQWVASQVPEGQGNGVGGQPGGQPEGAGAGDGGAPPAGMLIRGARERRRLRMYAGAASDSNFLQVRAAKAALPLSLPPHATTMPTPPRPPKLNGAVCAQRGTMSMEAEDDGDEDEMDESEAEDNGGELGGGGADGGPSHGHGGGLGCGGGGGGAGASAGQRSAAAGGKGRPALQWRGSKTGSWAPVRQHTPPHPTDSPPPQPLPSPPSAPPPLSPLARMSAVLTVAWGAGLGLGLGKKGGHYGLQLGERTGQGAGS